MKTRILFSKMAMLAAFPLMSVSCSSCDSDHSPESKPVSETTEGVQHELMPFEYTNPLDFSYPYFDGEQEVIKTELRDPCIMRDGDTYYLVFTHFPFTHHDARDPEK